MTAAELQQLVMAEAPAGARHGYAHGWSTERAFYQDDPRRITSPEVDYGVWWVEPRGGPRYRVSWCVATGDVYAKANAGTHPALIRVLGIVPCRLWLEAGMDGWAAPQHRPDRYGPLEEILQGWAAAADDHGRAPLPWVRNRLQTQELPGDLVDRFLAKEALYRG